MTYKPGRPWSSSIRSLDWSEKTEISAGQWLNSTASKFYDWRERYGKVNEHSGSVPRDFWLEDWEKQATGGFHLKNPLEGYRRLTFRMLDADIVALSPSSVWRVLSQGRRPTVHRQGLQGVHPDLGHDARPDFAVLPAVERENRAPA